MNEGAPPRGYAWQRDKPWRTVVLILLWAELVLVVPVYAYVGFLLVAFERPSDTEWALLLAGLLLLSFGAAAGGVILAATGRRWIFLASFLLVILGGLVLLAWPVELRYGVTRPLLYWMLPLGTIHR